MNWEAVGAISELVGAIAVVSTLIYLTVQVRQNTGMLRSTAEQHIETRIAAMIAEWSVPEKAKLLRAGMADMETLDDDERIQFFQKMASFFLTFDTEYRMWVRKEISDEIWERDVAVLDFPINSNGGQAVWQQIHVTKSFRNYAEKNLIKPNK